MLESTWSEAAICGTHLGCTKLPASMVSMPVAASRRTSSILVSTDMLVFSFCKPSLGPTSTMRTWSFATEARGEMEKLRRPAGRRTCVRRLRKRGVMVAYTCQNRGERRGRSCQRL
jgi:hypothetical protein